MICWYALEGCNIPVTRSNLCSKKKLSTRRVVGNWSHPCHYLVDPYTWPWSPNGQDHIWPWKFKYQGHGQGQIHCHIWGLEFNRCVRFKFHGNRTIFGRDIANSIFDLENSRSRSWPRSILMVTFEVLRSIDMFAFRFVAIAPFFAEIYSIRYLTLKIQGQGHGQGQTWWSHLKPRVQMMCLLFVSWQSDHFWLRYSQFDIWPWKFKVKVTTKIAQNLTS